MMIREESIIRSSTENIIDQINEHRNDFIKRLLNTEFRKTYLIGELHLINPSNVKLEFIKRFLKELESSVVDLSHYAALILETRRKVHSPFRRLLSNTSERMWSALLKIISRIISQIYLFMNLIFIPGSRCLLDGKIEVIVIKPVTRSQSTYNVEIPGRSIETVAHDRLPYSRLPTPFQLTPNRNYQNDRWFGQILSNGRVSPLGL